MRFTETPLAGAFIIDIDPIEDERGFFARTFCRKEFERHGLNPNVVQCSISRNHKCGTLRGMHFQRTPHEETKLVWCASGAVYDVIIDLRPRSEKFKQWFSIELSAANGRMLYIPEGFAHGFQTLKENTTVFYQMSTYHAPGYVQGVRWDDPAFAIHWPPADRVISSRDRGYPDFTT